ncbi:hypothetical protein [Falsirhodobacter halotolerans]|uniref:hypothetical protein n=1 Tax=Falsirhodobacter halotolerans TaxID=1146892 RepID=UPI001FD5300F|nr:hypothetical protein [Falsirhodobacter halotolerans]MCJ8139515.1 hypothetical protein [Falsirhodobacter halotolerans]
MKNRFLGEVTVELDGETYTLRMDMNAMILFEDMTGKDPFKAFEMAEEGNADMRLLRSIGHAMLMKHHPDATIELAGEIISSDINAIGRALQAASPEVGTGSGVKPAGKTGAGRTRVR